jgi:hypothetical protein
MSLRTTAVRVTELGVVLCDAHRARLGPSLATAFDAFAAQATAGVYSLVAHGERLEIIKRPGSRLFDGIGTRLAVSPLAATGLCGPQPKVTNPSPYEALRVPNLATLLTNSAGTELWESCVAGLFAFDGHGLVAVPEQTPRVDSVAVKRVLDTLPHRRGVIAPAAGWPLVLVNALLTCVPEGPTFPHALRVSIDETLRATTKRP